MTADSTIEFLQYCFPELPQDVIASLLEINGDNVEATVSLILLQKHLEQEAVDEVDEDSISSISSLSAEDSVFSLSEEQENNRETGGFYWKKAQNELEKMEQYTLKNVRRYRLRLQRSQTRRLIPVESSTNQNIPQPSIMEGNKWAEMNGNLEQLTMAFPNLSRGAISITLHRNQGNLDQTLMELSEFTSDIGYNQFDPSLFKAEVEKGYFVLLYKLIR